MTDQHWQLEKDFYTITVPSDLVLRVVEHHNITSPPGATAVRAVPNKVHVFRVDLETLAEASEYFSTLLEPRPSEVQVDENDAGNVTGLLMWLKIIHYVVTKDTYELHLYEIWHVCSVAMKYGFSPYHPKAEEWFDDWYNNQPQIQHFNFRHYEQLLFPTWFFDHAIGFAQATKYLAYRSNGPISEVQPEQFRSDPVVSIGTDAAIMIQINAARGRLITVLHRALYAPISKLLSENKCHCGSFILFAYQKALADTGCWPIHPALEKMSVRAALDSLSQFVLVPTQVCRKGSCNLDLQNLVANTIKDVDGQFAGLCLDCMQKSNPENTGSSKDYWHNEQPGVAWDEGCRISHPQPSWFFSFLGDRAEINQYLQGKTRQQTDYYRHERNTYGYGNNGFPRGGGSTRGSRQEPRKSTRPGRQDSVVSPPVPPGGFPGHAIQNITNRMANTNISESQTLCATQPSEKPKTSERE